MADAGSDAEKMLNATSRLFLEIANSLQNHLEISESKKRALLLNEFSNYIKGGGNLYSKIISMSQYEVLDVALTQNKINHFPLPADENGMIALFVKDKDSKRLNEIIEELQRDGEIYVKNEIEELKDAAEYFSKGDNVVRITGLTYSECNDYIAKVRKGNGHLKTSIVPEFDTYDISKVPKNERTYSIYAKTEDSFVDNPNNQIDVASAYLEGIVKTHGAGSLIRDHNEEYDQYLQDLAYYVCMNDKKMVKTLFPRFTNEKIEATNGHLDIGNLYVVSTSSPKRVLKLNSLGYTIFKSTSNDEEGYKYDEGLFRAIPVSRDNTSLANFKNSLESEIRKMNDCMILTPSMFEKYKINYRDFHKDNPRVMAEEADIKNRKKEKEIVEGLIKSARYKTLGYKTEKGTEFKKVNEENAYNYFEEFFKKLRSIKKVRIVNEIGDASFVPVPEYLTDLVSEYCDFESASSDRKIERTVVDDKLRKEFNRKSNMNIEEKVKSVTRNLEDKKYVDKMNKILISSFEEDEIDLDNDLEL